MRRRPPAVALAAALALLPTLSGQTPGGKETRITPPAFLSRFISGEYRRLDDRRRQLETDLLSMWEAPRNERGAQVGWKMFGYGTALVREQWVEIDLGDTYAIDAVCLVPVDVPTADYTAPGLGFPQRFRVILEGENGAKTVVADHAEQDFPNPGNLPVYLKTPGVLARRVRVTMGKPWSKDTYRAYALGEIMVLQGNRNLATGLAGVKVRTSGSFESAPAWSRMNLIDGQSIVGAPVKRSDQPFLHGWESAYQSDAFAPVSVQVDLGRIQSFDEVRLIPAKLTEFSLTHGYGFPLRFRVEVSDEPGFAAAHTLLDCTSRPYGDASFSPVTIPAQGISARYVRITAHELWQRSEGVYTFALAELQVYKGNENVALGSPVTTPGAYSTHSATFSPEALTDGLRASQAMAEWPQRLGELSHRRELLVESAQVQARLAALRPVLARKMGWALAILLALVVLAAVVVWLRVRHRQARAISALQRQIAGDLHDEIGSNLASIALLAEMGPHQNALVDGGDIHEIRRLASESAAAMRDIVWLTQPGPHDVRQLSERLQAAAQRLLKGLEWKFEIDGLDAAPPLDVQRHLLLALKEMLNNVLRHASAHRVEIRLAVHEGHFTLSVQDDGGGFEVSRAGGGHGFTSLRHRSELLHGKFDLVSRPGAGTRVALSGQLHPPGGSATLPA